MPWKAWVAAVAIAGAAFAADRADAAPNVAHLSWGSQLNPSDCPDDGYRYLEVNVTGQVVNDAGPGAGRRLLGPSRVQPPHPGVEGRHCRAAGHGGALLCPREIPGLLDDDRRR